MRAIFGRLILDRPKNLLIVTAIATLLVQPLYIPLSAGIAYAATQPEANTTNIEPTMTVSDDGQSEPESTPITIGNEKISINDEAYDRNTPYASGESLVIRIDTPDPDIDESTHSASHSWTVRESQEEESKSNTLTLTNPKAGTYNIKYTLTYTSNEEDNQTPPTVYDAELSINVINRKLDVSMLEDPAVEGVSVTFTIEGKSNIPSDEIFFYTYIRNLDTDDIDSLTDPQRTEEVEDSGLSVVYANYQLSDIPPGNYVIDYQISNSREENPGDFNTSEPFSITTPAPGPGEGKDEDEDVVDSPGLETEEPVTANPEIPTEGNTEPEDENREEDDEEGSEDDTLAAAIDPFVTGIASSSDPLFTSIVNRTAEYPMDDEDRRPATPGPTAGQILNDPTTTDEKGVANFLNVAWYWWVALVAAITSIWSLIAAGLRKKPSAEDF